MSIAEHRHSDRRDIAATLRSLPRRRPHDQPSAEAPPVPHVEWVRIEVDGYEIRRGGAILGYIDVVGAVFVVHSGSRRDRAVEVLQTLVWERAVAALAGNSA